ncbi:MAG: flavodoxin domain-containing protein [Candidatus Methanomethylophilaceae archaeon]|nr:flavodoxin domain-containing protein [Candidatus Methanomethylophilaceae archaeon]
MTGAIFYATKSGATEGVAKYIARNIGAETINLDKDPNADLSKYDRVILGSGVYLHKVPKTVSDFATKYADLMPKVSLYLVCAFKDEEGDEQLQRISSELGVGYGVYFNNPRRMMGMEGSKLELFIEHLNNGK